ncbi:response regulator [Spirosoma soli]|uniref:Response regulator n=1 Tax=Spirosoma soli TaxID=1770529 RepID=A0ABW5M5P5_9BACT
MTHHTQPTRILLVDDHRLFSNGLNSLLSAEADLDVVGQVFDGFEVVSAVHRLRPDVILLDINLPRQNGQELVPELLRTFPHVRIIMVTMYAESHLVDTFKQLGVHGYMLKNVDHRELLTGIRLVRAGGRYFDSSLAKPHETARHNDDAFIRKFQLTPRELEILQGVCTGLSSQQLAEQLNLSYLTVKSHRRNIHFKLGTTTTVDLIRFAQEHGLTA